MRQAQARARRMERSRRRREQLSRSSHRAPSPILTEPGGSRESSPRSTDFVPSYRVGGERKLNRRVMDIKKPEERQMQIWVTGGFPPADTVYVNGRSDRTARHSTGRTLRPGSDYSAPPFEPAPPDPVRDGWGWTKRAMSRPGYRPVGR